MSDALDCQKAMDKKAFCPYPPDKGDALVSLVGQGVAQEVAAKALQVTLAEIRFWRESVQDFGQAMDEAEAEVERTAVGQIVQAAEKDWRAAAWLLERKFPQRWEKKKPEQNPLEGLSEQEVQAVVKRVGILLPAFTMDLAGKKGRRKT